MDIKACKKLGGTWNPRTKRCKAFYSWEVHYPYLILYKKDNTIIERYNLDIVVNAFLDKEGLEIF